MYEYDLLASKLIKGLPFKNKMFPGLDNKKQY